ncbi:Uu.00g090740.m01.CDS01 [Anthostomella pinea]|uniref:Uu.00g090740.m01.CDS01 n=1 Tax=Anthostomella pinea TaxID=933095 RepID=A0AAI8VN18_9PEZI|nr:Uu.00g090740.m01.CDS01 [Anthostomella pinea]
MADSVDEINVTYEELAELEKEFDDVDTEIVRQQVALTKPLYEKRAKVIAKIPNFWALVIEAAPQDIDQYIFPSDSAALLSSVTNLSVSHFEIEDGSNGDPRSISIKFEFEENEFFENKVLEKKFWYRRSKDGFAGLVSEPVPIKWKAGKDLTDGLLDMAVNVWEQDKKQGQANGDSKKQSKAKDWRPDQKALKEKIDASGLGAVSFFCWFGYRGEHVSAEESRIATEEEKKRRADKAAGKDDEAPELKEADEDEDEDEEDDENDPDALEIFPDGDELAIAFSEDLFPNAIKFFTQAQEEDALSEVDFEEDDEDMDDDAPMLVQGEDKSDDEAPPSKKRKP